MLKAFFTIPALVARAGIAFGTPIARAGIAFAALIACAGIAFAQSPAVNPAEADSAKQQQQRQITQPLNNQPVWSEVRTGAPQTTTVTGRETNVLIQPQGQTWRSLRNGEISVYAGWALVVMFLAVAAFYWRKA